MRLLWASSVFPYPATDGNRQRNYHLLRSVATQHAITLVVPISPGEEEGLSHMQKLCSEVVAIPAAPALGGFGRISARVRAFRSGWPLGFVPREAAEMIAAARRLSATEPFDVALGGVYVAPVLFAAKAKAYLVDDHDAHVKLYERLFRLERKFVRRLARLMDWHAVARFEGRYLRLADVVTLCNRVDDAELQRRYGPLTTHLIPNGADVRGIPYGWHPTDPPRIVLAGAMSYASNVTGATFFVRRILPIVRRRRPDVEVWLVGKDPASEVLALRSSNVIVTGALDDIVSTLRQASISIVPTLVGGGSRLKILESMAVGVPVVSTLVAAEGVDAVDRREMWLARDPEEFAVGVVTLIEDRNLAMTMSQAARRLVETQYAWERIGSVFRAVVEDVGIRASAKFRASTVA